MRLSRAIVAVFVVCFGPFAIGHANETLVTADGPVAKDADAKNKDDQSSRAKNSGAWSAGIETVNVGMPGTLNSASANVNTASTKSGSRGEFLAVPIPRVDPALGTGLIGAAAYIFKLDPNDTESPASIIGAAGMWMDSGTWALGLAGKFYFNEDSTRLTTALAHAVLKYDLVTTSDTDSSELRLPLSQKADGGIIHAQFRVANHLYVGVRAQSGTLLTTLQATEAADLPESIEDDLGHEFRLNSLGPTFAYDTRDNTYYPRSGISLDAGVDSYFGSIDSDVSYNYYSLNYRQYLPLRGRDVLAWQAYVCATSGDPPFFLQCQVGPNSILRGYSFGEHRGNAMAATQVEYRWQPLERWIFVGFAGVAQAKEDFGDFDADGNLFAGGAGVRFVVEPINGVTLRVDYAVGKGEGALYVSVGEAF
jgi:hypothetical protein